MPFEKLIFIPPNLSEFADGNTYASAEIVFPLIVIFEPAVSLSCFPLKSLTIVPLHLESPLVIGLGTPFVNVTEDI